MRKFVPLALLGLLALGAAGCATTDSYGKQKVVYHVNSDDPKILKAAVGNVRTTSTPWVKTTLISKW